MIYRLAGAGSRLRGIRLASGRVTLTMAEAQKILRLGAMAAIRQKR